MATSDVLLRFLGSGDAFGSGGRYQACLMLSGGGGDLLLDWRSVIGRRLLGGVSTRHLG